MIKIFPSIIEGNILNLESQIKYLEPYCDGFHLDVMDFHFVPNLTFGPIFVNKITQITNKKNFIHLMVDNPEKWLDLLDLKKEDTFCFHVEASKNCKKIIDEIHKKNWSAGIAINPKTSLETIYPFISEIETVLLMSVEPGFSGQKFIPNTLDKIKQLVQYKKDNNLKFSITIDGGVNEKNIAELTKLGVENFAIGSAIFKKNNSLEVLKNFYNL